MEYFFYGTLCDEDVRRRVLGRVPRGVTVEEAELPGYRAVYVAGASYPTLIPGMDVRAPGLLVRGLGPADAARLAAFEGPSYQVHRMAVSGRDGSPVTARVFVTRAGVVATPRDWKLEEWRRKFKARYLEADPFRPR